MCDRILKRVGACVLFGGAALGGISFVVMSLWNALMPCLFSLRCIGYWQAMGLFVLSRILFGGFRCSGCGPRGPWRRRLLERWEQMSPEERAKFRDGFWGRCGTRGTGDSAGGTTTSAEGPATKV